jgi:hypothetical protein
MSSDIERFNDYVLTVTTKVQSRGEATQDLSVNLFKGYKSCSRTTEEETIIALQAQLKKLLSSARADIKWVRKASPEESPRVWSKLVIGKEAQVEEGCTKGR